jgi:uncharacterized membrane protein YfhO
VDWQATVDGRSAPVLRGDHALITVPVGPGARSIELNYHSKSFAKGKLLALLSTLIVIAWFVTPPFIQRRRLGGARG